MKGASLKPQAVLKSKSSCRKRHSSRGTGHTRSTLLTKIGLSDSSGAAYVLKFTELFVSMFISSLRCLKTSLCIIRMAERKRKRGQRGLPNISTVVCQITFWDSFLF